MRVAVHLISQKKSFAIAKQKKWSCHGGDVGDKLLMEMIHFQEMSVGDALAFEYLWCSAEAKWRPKRKKKSWLVWFLSMTPFDITATSGGGIAQR